MTIVDYFPSIENMIKKKNAPWQRKKGSQAYIRLGKI